MPPGPRNGSTPLRDQVRDDLRQRIVTGALVPGQRIVERDIAQQLGVSRLPVREAIRMLEAEHVVEMIPRRGVVVRRLKKRDVEELFDAREALEVLAVQQAAQRATDAELRRLSRIAETGTKAARAGDDRKAAASQERFHDEILQLSHNQLLLEMLGPLQARLHWLFRQGGDAQRLCNEHRKLAEAIATRDPELAGKEALDHVRRNRELSLQLMFG